MGIGQPTNLKHMYTNHGALVLASTALPRPITAPPSKAFLVNLTGREGLGLLSAREGGREGEGQGQGEGERERERERASERKRKEERVRE